MRKLRTDVITLLLCCHMVLSTLLVTAQSLDTLGLGWSRTSVNTVAFRKNSITTFKSNVYVSYYDTSGFVVIAHKKINEPWRSVKTRFKGRVEDAHNSISIMADGEGYVHIAWDHHNNKLNYARSKSPGSLDFDTPGQMVGKDEGRVTYPEFYRMPDGDLIFLYRNGESGNGNLVLNRYEIKAKKWRRIQDNLIDGENQRNAYWQAFVSPAGTIHISWVWREDPDVSTNHDLCYARSKDGGVTWEKSYGEQYQVPITVSTAEIARKIMQERELMNQTSMSATDDDLPVIATYWREKNSAVPQIFIVWNEHSQWKHEQVSQRTQPFTLKGGGTKNIPISRPQVIVKGKQNTLKLAVVYRDNERGHMLTFAGRKIGGWKYEDHFPITDTAWEPTYDLQRTGDDAIIRILVQDVGQGDGEKLSDKKPTPVVLMTIR